MTYDLRPLADRTAEYMQQAFGDDAEHVEVQFPAPCKICGATVGQRNRELHARWHLRIDEAFGRR